MLIICSSSPSKRKGVKTSNLVKQQLGKGLIGMWPSDKEETRRWETGRQLDCYLESQFIFKISTFNPYRINESFLFYFYCCFFNYHIPTNSVTPFFCLWNMHNPQFFYSLWWKGTSRLMVTQKMESQTNMWTNKHKYYCECIPGQLQTKTFPIMSLYIQVDPQMGK